MNIFKRANISIKRKPVKSITIMLIVFILGNLIVGAITVKNSVAMLDLNMKKKYGRTFAIRSNSEDMDKDKVSSIIEYTSEDLEKIGDLPFVHNFDYSITTTLNSEFLKGKSLNNYNFNNISDFSAIGVNNPEILKLKELNIDIKNGRTFYEEEIKSDNNYVIVSDWFCKENNLNLGDEFELNYNMSEVTNGDTFEDITYEPTIVSTYKQKFKILGVFEVPEDIGNEQNRTTITYNLTNSIFMTNLTAMKIENFERNESKRLNREPVKFYNESTFILKYPLDAEKFKKEAKDILPKYFEVYEKSEIYTTISTLLENIKGMINIVLIVVSIASIFILSLLITLFLRDRKHEIGIYIALGEKKKNVILQVIIEVSIIAFIAVVLALFTGNILAKTVSNNLVNDALIQELEAEGPVVSMENVSADEIISEFDVGLNTNAIIVIFGMSFMIIIFSTLISSIYILKVNPKKILM